MAKQLRTEKKYIPEEGSLMHVFKMIEWND